MMPIDQKENKAEELKYHSKNIKPTQVTTLGAKI
jgi:hypothetical protein